MTFSLNDLRHAGRTHRVWQEDKGFMIEREADADVAAFNCMVREALDSAGNDFAAFPQPDGHHGYSAIYVVPLD